LSSPPSLKEAQPGMVKIVLLYLTVGLWVGEKLCLGLRFFAFLLSFLDTNPHKALDGSHLWLLKRKKWETSWRWAYFPSFKRKGAASGSLALIPSSKILSHFDFAVIYTNGFSSPLVFFF
jgi:hypothetical protein